MSSPPRSPQVRAAADLIDEHIRLVPDFPSPGVLFRDLSPVLGHPHALHMVSAAMWELAGSPQSVAALEARGFLLGAAAAVHGGVGVLPLRKPGKLPGSGTDAVLREEYELEYGSAALELQPADLAPGTRVVIIDDVLATGGTAAAAIELVRRAAATVTGVVVAIELVDLGGRARIPTGVPVHALAEVG